jgi:membrane protein YqaA with SNARE-associated domain
MNLLLFCVIGLVGRWLRFVVVLGGAEWLSGYLR